MLERPHVGALVTSPAEPLANSQHQLSAVGVNQLGRLAWISLRYTHPQLVSGCNCVQDPKREMPCQALPELLITTS